MAKIVKKKVTTIKKVAPVKSETATSTKTYRSLNMKILNWIEENSTLAHDKGRWYAGISNDPKRRKPEHQQRHKVECKFWKHWDARNVGIALALESSLCKRGLCHEETAGGANKDSRYIYIYKKYPTVFD